MLRVARRCDQPGDLLAAQYHGQLARFAHRTHHRHQLAAVERDLEEEPEARDRRVDRHRRSALINQVQLKSPQILPSGSVGRAAQEAGQASHGAHIGDLRLAVKLAQAHVLDHALAKWGDNLSRWAHGSAPVEERGGLPRSSTSQNQRRNELPRDSR